MSNGPKHAVVIGGSMAGMTAAAVLAKHFDQVTLIDRDEFPAVGEHRRCVPQSRHTHALLASGRGVLERLFPGLAGDMLEHGGVPGDVCAQGQWYMEGGLFCKTASGMEGIFVSRPLLEGLVRRRMAEIANIRVIPSTIVENLTTDSAKTRVTGVRLAEREIAADLVVDASGRASHAPDWLDVLGYGRPEAERIEVGVGYTTRLFRRHPSHLDGDLAAVIPAHHSRPWGAVMLAQEDDRWTVTAFSYFRNYAPEDLAGFREWIGQLPCKNIYNAIKEAEPIGNAYTARYPASVRMHYEKMIRFPQGFLVFGDAICSFNPTFGQGMSVAALEAAELERCLAEGGFANLAKRFFAAASKVVDIPWATSVGADLTLPETKGPRTIPGRIIGNYIAALHKAGHRDPEAVKAFLTVANLLAPPPSVMAPRIAIRVFRAWLGRIFSGGRSAQQQPSPTTAWSARAR